MMEYQYPFSYDWTTQEIIDVIKFFEAIETVYEKGMNRDEFMTFYRRFKEIVPSKAEEKKYCNEFADSSGYSPYHVVKKMKESNPGDFVKMES
jgi:uncharacterized protein YktA (UPF0223 family)